MTIQNQVVSQRGTKCPCRRQSVGYSDRQTGDVKTVREMAGSGVPLMCFGSGGALY